MSSLSRPSNKSFVLLAAFAGFFSLAALAWTASESRAGNGEWKCFVSDRFPDVDDAASWKGSIRVADGLNKIAAHVPAGEMITIEVPVRKSAWGNMGGTYSEGAPSVICVKY